MKSFRHLLCLSIACTAAACSGSDADDAALLLTRQVPAPRSGLIAPDQKPADRGAHLLTESVQVHDGRAEREVWIDPSLVADFSGDERAEALIRASNALAVELDRPSPRMRLWRVDGRRGGRELVRSLNASDPAARFSPVFRESADPASPRRALPGGVIVRFPDAWDRAQVDAFLLQHELSLERELPLDHTYLIATEPGLAAVEVARVLRATGEPIAVSPNWWRESSVR